MTPVLPTRYCPSKNPPLQVQLAVWQLGLHNSFSECYQKRSPAGYDYSDSLKDIIDLQAPLLNRTITLRPHAPWYSDELRDAKHKRRQLECRWRSTKLEVHHQLYRDYCVVINRLLCSTKIAYYETQIVQCPHNSKSMLVVYMPVSTTAKCVMLKDRDFWGKPPKFAPNVRKLRYTARRERVL